MIRGLATSELRISHAQDSLSSFIFPSLFPGSSPPRTVPVVRHLLINQTLWLEQFQNTSLSLYAAIYLSEDALVWISARHYFPVYSDQTIGENTLTTPSSIYVMGNILLNPNERSTENIPRCYLKF